MLYIKQILAVRNSFPYVPLKYFFFPQIEVLININDFIISLKIKNLKLGVNNNFIIQDLSRTTSYN